MFSQLKATVSGNVSCIVDADCKNLRVQVRQVLKSSSDGYEIIAEVISMMFVCFLNEQNNLNLFFVLRWFL